ncbi:hypothetical protein H8K33_16005 [Undibacterium amnicola]|uniref:Uncharacterized protein n=1 Tax=Undibacterium amnicola TaxID=1834038 RepID=A0ABR6XU79_9BURK|nr:hypothetical protein [Undibacterium amnicola]MBC3833014.1 hypothetical protein [Undibacterium amnicola]
MKSQLDFRQASISILTGLLSAFLLGLAGFFQNSLNWTYFLVFFFVGLGMHRFITAIFNIIAPLQAKQADPKDLENKAIVAEVFKQSRN